MQRQMGEKMKKILTRVLECKGDRSAASFARMLDMRQQTVDNYLTGRRKFSVEFLASICCSCGVSADWLLGFTDDRTGTAAPATDPAMAEKDAEIERLRGEISGLRYALDAVGGGEFEPWSCPGYRWGHECLIRRLSVY